MGDDNRTQEPDDRQPPALPAPWDGPGDDRPRGRATGRDYSAARHYSPEERMALIYQAIRDGVSATSERHSVPRSTLVTWLEEYGGIGAVRAWLQEQTLADFLRFEQSLYAEATRRLEKLPNDEFGMVLRKLIEVRTGMLVPPGQDGQPAAAAAAQATVTVRVEGGDGERVIDLGPPPEDPE